MTNEVDYNYIRARLGKLTVYFPSPLVAEIFLTEQSQFLSIPFYPPAIAGCVHHGGKIIPLVFLAKILNLETSKTRKVSVIRLNEQAQQAAGIGIITERIIGTSTKSEMTPELLTNFSTDNMILFQPSMLNSDLWQPQRWIKQ
jgi:chemotaxis signal transduction protein